MAITYINWNVQNFGQKTRAYWDAKGINSSRLVKFIAYLVKRNAASILSIMEVTPAALPDLRQLLTALNTIASEGKGDWMFDYIKGATAGDTLPGQNLNSANLLSWKSGATAPRQEGYALFWRDAHPDFEMLWAAQTMSEGAWHGKNYQRNAPVEHAISLSVHGRDVRSVTSTGPRLRPVVNFNPNAPLSSAEFPSSYFPDVARGLGAQSLYWSDSRRPAYALIWRKVGGEFSQEQRVVPLLAYHAPSYSGLAGTGVYVSGMARELYAVPGIDVKNRPALALISPVRFVASGDFNAPADGGKNFDYYYSAYKNPFNKTSVIGNEKALFGVANGTPIYDGDNAVSTTIQIYEPINGLFNGDPINSPQNSAYEFSAIDNMFHRACAPTYFGIVDVLSELQGVDSDIAAGIKAYATKLAGLDANRNTSPNSGPVRNGEQVFSCFQANIANDWKTFLQGVQAGKMKNARSAALFMRMFVSDHLPMMIRFT